jgi:hypothetical protein
MSLGAKKDLFAADLGVCYFLAQLWRLYLNKNLTVFTCASC